MNIYEFKFTHELTTKEGDKERWTDFNTFKKCNVEEKEKGAANLKQIDYYSSYIYCIHCPELRITKN